jgi:hypothetical protein
MPRPRTLDAHPREFFAFTEELLTVPSRTVDCGGPGPRKAFALRAGMYHFWARLRTEIEARQFNLTELDALAGMLVAGGKVPDSADGRLLRALYRVASNTSISIEGTATVRFQPKSQISLAAVLAENLAVPAAPLADGGAGLLAELERSGGTKLD